MARKKPQQDDGIDDLASILPPGDGPPIAEAVAERQAEAVASTAPPVGAGDPALGVGNIAARVELVRSKLERLEAIKAEVKELNEESALIIKDLEKESGVNRGALSDVRRIEKLSPAAIRAREESREELFALWIKPKLDAADSAGSEG